MEKQTGQGAVCADKEEGQAGKASQRRWLCRQTQRRHPLPGTWEEAMKAEKSENKQLPLCLLPAKVRGAQKNSTKG